MKKIFQVAVLTFAAFAMVEGSQAHATTVSCAKKQVAALLCQLGTCLNDNQLIQAALLLDPCSSCGAS